NSRIYNNFLKQQNLCKPLSLQTLQRVFQVLTVKFKYYNIIAFLSQVSYDFAVTVACGRSSFEWQFPPSSIRFSEFSRETTNTAKRKTRLYLTRLLTYACWL